VKKNSDCDESNLPHSGLSESVKPLEAGKVSCMIEVSFRWIFIEPISFRFGTGMNRNGFGQCMGLVFYISEAPCCTTLAKPPIPGIGLRNKLSGRTSTNDP
jgi:hypothetical protein